MPPPENLVLIRYMARQFVVPIYPDFQGRSWYLGSDRNMVFSINYQHLYGLKREWDFHLNLESADNKSFSVIHCDNSVALSALGLAWGIQFSPNFSFGLTLNIWDNWPGKNQWSEKQQEKEHGIYIDIDSPDDNQKYETDYALTNHFDFNGVNLNIGFLWEISNNLKLGAVFKSPFRANLSHESHLQDIRIFKYDYYPDDIVPYSVSEQTDEKLDMPMSYGLGIAYAYAKNLRFSMDIHRTHWNDFVLHKDNGVELCPLNGQPTDRVNIKPTHQVRMGMEYNIIKPAYVTSIRSGLFYDPAPAQGNPDDYYGFSLGSGIKFERFSVDASYQFRFGNDVGDTLLKQYEFSQDIQEHTFLMSLIYYL
jgi:long-subunit fatty acid transport protein